MKDVFQKFAGWFSAREPGANDVVLKPGDIIIQHKDRKGWCAVKILAIDPFDGHSPTAHCLTYDYTPQEPTLVTVSGLAVKVWHAPISAGAFEHDWKHIGNQKVSPDELGGFVEYLKLTDFPRYIEFTGQDVEQVINRANAHYHEALILHDQGKAAAAIPQYEKAIDVFPLFFEAIDNRAFALMELGLFDRALSGFRESLHVNPDGMAAFFSKGECLLRLGSLREAEQVFAAGLLKFPEHSEIFQNFLDEVRGLKN
ncbi:hypothetical protein ABAC460_12110 [Asticcacaulis sp. AC460]|uniref:tetratricopeptide repeat protein n=1 Tax=Asticcacaulis sp. AC460 TaxID=1282360 RepID=UPI0003C3CC27|nr:tetratricopeptide repeat protein [Asticcacaulis sp. AC460]ESQ89606.1 hypothetical protein ABAC460_12110 [Asticcacaulis sp. AC460]